MKRRFIDRFEVLLLDMGLTFMFNSDRFSDLENYGATYRKIGGTLLNDGKVNEIISRLFDRLMSDYQNPTLYDHYPSVLSHLRTIPKARDLPEEEIWLLERVFDMHEIGEIPVTYAEALHQLHETHRLGIISNIWAKGELFLQEFEKAGIRHLFDTIIFSSDYGCVKPSRHLFYKAMEAFEVGRSKMVFIGDSPDRDVAGAKSVGLSAIWINNGMNHSFAGIARPDLVIHDLWDLLEI